MDKYIGSKSLGIAHFPSLFKPNNHFFFYHNNRYIKGTVAYFAFTHVFIFLFLFIDFFFPKALYMWSGTRFKLFKIKVIQTQNIFLCHASSVYNKHVMVANSTRITVNTYSTLNFILSHPF